MKTAVLVSLSAGLALAIPACALVRSEPGRYAGRPLPLPSPSSAEPRPAGIAARDLPDALTLEKAIAICTRSHPSLEASFLRVEAARARVAQAWSAYAPAIRAGILASRVFESAPSVAMGTPGFTPDDRYGIFATRLEVSWRIFDGFAREYRLLQARAARHGTEALHEEGRRLLARSAGAAFFAVLLAREQRAVAREDWAFNRTMLENARKRKAAGTASEADVLGFTVRVNASEAERIRAEGNLRVHRLALAALLGLEDGAWPGRVELVAPRFPREATDPDPLTLAREALASRPDVVRARCLADQASATVGEAWGAFFPSLDMSFQAGHQRKDDARWSYHDLSASGSLALSWTFFSGGSRFAALREARADARARRLETAALRRAVTREVLQAAEALSEARRKLRFHEKNEAISLRLRDMEARSFERGTTSRLVLDQAQNDAMVARLKAAMGRIEVQQARFDLLLAAGRMPAGK